MQDIIAVVFDFDDTLAPDSTSSFLENYGLNVKSFWTDEVQPLLTSGWDPVPAYLYKMLEKSNIKQPITRQLFKKWGRQISPYNGATLIFRRLIQHIKSVNPKVSIEFYLISSGIGEILRSTNLAKHFLDIWACDFFYDKGGKIVFPKNIVSFTDKTRYLFQIAKGFTGVEYKGKPFEVNKKINNENLRIPFNQMVYVGDGYTDIPCFSLIRKSGGIAIGVFDKLNKEKWGRAWGFIENDRVSNLAPADYGKNLSLSISLMMAVENIAERIMLHNKTYQG
ncbi:MAG TPA: HAD family hydrolase [Nitrospirae bacterium]|nr:HAD family hydrolase [Nitrospirota bacterium]HDZ03063.1 HAD family hydrolase [Nitrospirota bacterium]